MSYGVFRVNGDVEDVIDIHDDANDQAVLQDFLNDVKFAGATYEEFENGFKFDSQIEEDTVVEFKLEAENPWADLVSE